MDRTGYNVVNELEASNHCRTLGVHMDSYESTYLTQIFYVSPS